MKKKKDVEIIHHKIGNIPLIIAKTKVGYIATNYLDYETAEKVGDVAAFVYNVKNLRDFMNAKIRKATTWAEDLGIREGISVKRALQILSTVSDT